MADADDVIDAAPTKEFFVEMLVRDIELVPAIGDLIDNCVDGARRLRPEGSLAGLFVRLTVSGEAFSIEDNCGGIPVDVAQHYAFRFGRPQGMAATLHSIGQFGVGMKRALFKLGDEFTVASRTSETSFTMSVDVPEWQQTPEWQFQFSAIGSGDLVEQGTSIQVTRLHPSTAESLTQPTFIARLARTIGAQHQHVTSEGLLITLNGTPIGGEALELLSSALLKPATQELELFSESAAPVRIRIYVGVVAKSHPPDAGWYVYCNGRLVLGADKTEATGWSSAGEQQFVRYHNRYARFRGYVFFDSDDASKLPWTTTKTALDTDSPVYKRAVQAMLTLARPVTTFLYELSLEIETPPPPGTELERIVDGAIPAKLASLGESSAFTYQRPVVRTRARPTTQSVQYTKPIAEIDAVKRALKVYSAAEAGARTFDYFYKRECLE